MVSVKASESTGTTGPSFDWREVGHSVREHNLTLHHGFCLPASCSANKVIEYANRDFSGNGLEAFATKCRTNDPVKVTAVDVLAL